MSDPRAEGARFPLRACVSLCYDGSDLSHLEAVVPLLDALELSGTFYAHAPALLDHAARWQAAANSGHELGGHSLYDSVDERGNLPRWTLDMVEQDLRLSRSLLAELFPRQPDFSFAYPGPETRCLSVPFDPRPADYREAVARVFEVARSALEGFNDMETCDIGYLRILPMQGRGTGEMIAAARETHRRGAWSLFVFGPVGAGSGEAEAHDRLCRWLADSRDWIECENVWRRAMRVRSIREAPGLSLYMKVEGEGGPGCEF